VTQTLAPTDNVEHSILVPFDNNIAQRNLVPVSAKMGSSRGFFINNPFEEISDVDLVIRSNLSEGWRVHTDLAAGAQIRLAPRERRWVEVRLERRLGADVTDSRKPQQVQVTGLIRGKPIGGMTFYLAPPSAFPGPPNVEGPSISQEDFFCLRIPWHDCEVDGTIRVNLRFGKE
jgi:hypothetical protein